jgi:hypothetical protein
MDQRIFPLAAKLAMQTGEFREPFAILGTSTLPDAATSPRA